MDEQTISAFSKLGPWGLVLVMALAYLFRDFLPAAAKRAEAAADRERQAVETREKRHADRDAFIQQLVTDARASYEKLVEQFRVDLKDRDERFSAALARHSQEHTAAISALAERHERELDRIMSLAFPPKKEQPHA